jgi:hypothetical protein
LSSSEAAYTEGLTLRQAALTAGFCYLLTPVTFAEFYIFPKLVIPGQIEQTAQNITAHGKFFVVGILCHLITLILDVVSTWALYILLAPVNRSLSLLTAWFRLVYTVMALNGVLKMVTVFRLLKTPDYLTLFGHQQLLAQVQLLLRSFRYDWSMGLVIFGIHLSLLGYLIFRSRYMPKALGILLLFVGISWIFYSLRPYLYPTANLGFIPITGFGELILPLWLLIKGWRIPEPVKRS